MLDDLIRHWDPAARARVISLMDRELLADVVKVMADEDSSLFSRAVDEVLEPLA